MKWKKLSKNIFLNFAREQSLGYTPFCHKSSSGWEARTWLNGETVLWHYFSLAILKTRRVQALCREPWNACAIFVELEQCEVLLFRGIVSDLQPGAKQCAANAVKARPFREMRKQQRHPFSNMHSCGRMGWSLIIWHVSVTMAQTNRIDGRMQRDSANSHVPLAFGPELALPAPNQLIWAMRHCKFPP